LGDPSAKEEAMKFLLLIHQGDAPTPRDPDAWGRLSEEERNAVYADYQAISQTPGVTSGPQLGPPEEATTVRVQDGGTISADGPSGDPKGRDRRLPDVGGRRPRRGDPAGRPHPGGPDGRRHRSAPGGGPLSAR
jgi:hypothetical protein